MTQGSPLTAVGCFGLVRIQAHSPNALQGPGHTRQIDPDYSHQVEIAIPEGGLGTRLNAMHDFCRGADFRTRGIGVKRLETRRDGVRFCFNAPERAEAFQARFGGSPLRIEIRSGSHA